VAAGDLRQLQEEWGRGDEAVAAMDLDDTVEVDGDAYSLKMIYLHLIGECSRHNGHADLLRERIDGRTGR